LKILVCNLSLPPGLLTVLIFCLNLFGPSKYQLMFIFITNSVTNYWDDSVRSKKTKTCLLLLCGLILFQSAGAQLCQGSLGDPIVNITFGSGSNPGPALSAATTNYSFRPGDCPNDGDYSVVNSTSACFSNSWHSISADHTGNTNGYFMLVNASFQPSAFYVDTVNVLCNNTTYEFAAWVMNMIRASTCSNSPIRPNLTFSVERTNGTVLQTINTGDMAASAVPTWKQYGFFFTTPADVSRVVVRIVNNAPGGCGNDLALDDITFRPCGPMLNASIAGNGVLKEFCEGEAQPQVFSCTVSAGYTEPHFQWQESTNNGATWTDIPGANDLALNRDFSSSTPAATYQYRLAVSKVENINIPQCKINSNVLTVRVNAKPSKIISGNGPVCEGGSIRLSATGGSQYIWTGVNGFAAASSTVSLDNAQLSQSGNYFLEVINEAGCRRKDTVEVAVNPRPVAAATPGAVFICEGTSTNLTASGGSAYLWKPSAALSASSIADPVASPKDSTRYMVIVYNTFLCTDTAYVQVNVSKKPVASAGVDKYILQGQTAQLAGGASGTNISYSWSPSLFINDPNSLQPLVTPESDASYTLEVVSHDGCGVASDVMKVHVFKAIYVPNAFSPNGDGLNDTWNIPALNVYASYEILVFNRWGQIVYTSKDIGRPWNGSFKGKELPSGVYPYIIDIKEVPIKLTGWVMVVR
jgi:gliding motility-associated-like protein